MKTFSFLRNLLLGIFGMIYCMSSANHESEYSDWKNRGLKGKVKVIEQDFYQKLEFKDGNWVLDTSKIFMTHRIVFDYKGRMSLVTKKVKGKHGWKLLDYIYHFDSINGLPKGSICFNEREELAEKSEYQWRTKYLLESKMESPGFEFTLETIQFNEEYRSVKTIRRHLKKDKLISEETIEDEYNEEDEISRTNYTNTYYINPKRYSSKSTFNTYRIYSRDSRRNWLEMAVILEESEDLHYYTKRTIEYFR